MTILSFSLTGNDIRSEARVIRKSSSWKSGVACRIAGLQSVAGAVTLKFARLIEVTPSVNINNGREVGNSPKLDQEKKNPHCN